MEWTTFSPEERELAETFCTADQIQALKLWDSGLGYGSVGIQLGISESSARGRISRGLGTIERKRATTQTEGAA